MAQKKRSEKEFIVILAALILCAAYNGETLPLSLYVAAAVADLTFLSEVKDGEDATAKRPKSGWSALSALLFLAGIFAATLI